MAYEEAMVRIGNEQPSWVLRDILDRLPYRDVQAEAIRVILGQRSAGSTRT
jgi:hypothetical protein